MSLCRSIDRFVQYGGGYCAGFLYLFQGKEDIIQSYDTLKKVDTQAQPESIKTEGAIIHLSRTLFTEKIFDYKKNEKWTFQGNKPAIIDFWAEWCGPCRKMSPVLSELAEEYKDKIDVYKLNIDEEKEIAKMFKINSIPLLMYIPVNGEPVSVMVVKSKEQIRQAIENILLKN